MRTLFLTKTVASLLALPTLVRLTINRINLTSCVYLKMSLSQNSYAPFYGEGHVFQSAISICPFCNARSNCSCFISFGVGSRPAICGFNIIAFCCDGHHPIGHFTKCMGVQKNWYTKLLIPSVIIVIYILYLMFHTL